MMQTNNYHISYEQELKNKAHARRQEYEGALEAIAALIKEAPKLTIVHLVSLAIKYFHEQTYEKDSKHIIITDTILAETLKQFWRSEEWECLVSKL